MSSTVRTRGEREAPRRPRCSCLLLGVLALLLASAPPAGAESRYTEYQVKAAFLYNFAKFVEWPEDQVASAVPLVIAIVGRDPFGADLEAALAGKRLGERPIEIRRVRRARELEHAHVVFVSDSERTRVRTVLEKLAERGVLTVADFERFAERGGMIELFLDDNRVRFRINPEAAERAEIKLSANLLRHAEIVGGEGGERTPPAAAGEAEGAR